MYKVSNFDTILYLNKFHPSVVMLANDHKMEELNPLEPTTVIQPKTFVESNIRGRPSTVKAIKFSPQPKSIISRILKRATKGNSENKCLSTFHKNISSSDSVEKPDNTSNEIKTIPEHLSSNIQDYYSSDLTTSEDDPDSLNRNSFLEDHELNYFQRNNDVHIKYEEEPKLPEIVCYVCSHRSNSQKAHRQHLSTHRNQPYTCNFADCTYSCKLSCNLIKHKRIHTSEKPYLCDQCTFRSNFANSLKVHKRIHTSERPYSCQYCTYRCNSSSNLKKHCLHKHRNNT